MRASVALVPSSYANWPHFINCFSSDEISFLSTILLNNLIITFARDIGLNWVHSVRGVSLGIVD